MARKRYSSKNITKFWWVPLAGAAAYIIYKFMPMPQKSILEKSNKPLPSGVTAAPTLPSNTSTSLPAIPASAFDAQGRYIGPI